MLTTTFLKWDGLFFEKTDRIATETPLIPENNYMEKFEHAALQSASRNPEYWFRYVDDGTFVFWSHGELDNFLADIINIHPSIQLPIEREEQGQLFFLDGLVMSKRTR